MPDFNEFEVGATLQPLSTSSPNGSLQDGDPGLFYCLDFLTYVVNTYPGPRLLQEAAAIGVPITAAVKQAYPYEPLPEYLENQLNFPILCVYRTQGQTEQWTISFDHDVCGITVVYALPPLSAAQSERCLPLLKAVYDAIRRKTNDAWDPGYTPPGGSLGEQFVTTGLCNIEEIGFGFPTSRLAKVSTGFEYGRLAGTDGAWFPALIMRGYIIERDTYAPTIGGPSKFDGADITGNVKDGDGTVVLATSSTVVQASTQLPPSITSLSVTTGPVAGGTSVTITGALFLSGPPTVYFGPASTPQYATSVTFGSSSSLTITTPAVANAGLYDISIVNRDGQAVTSKGAFTFV